MSAKDLIVVLPGIMGSTLRDRDGDLVWAPSAGAAIRAIRTFGRSINQLQLPPGVGDEHPCDGVEPAGLMPDLHVLPGLWTPVKGYDKLISRLRALGYCETADEAGAPPGNLLPVPYDWRLSNRFNGQRLQEIVEPALERWRDRGDEYKDAKLTFVCHSMGGLVARWYIERCGGAPHTRRLITFGTPYRGAGKALGQLVNGVSRGLGPFAIDLTSFARSLPSLYQLLPEYACIESAGDLAKTTEVTVPELNAAEIADGMRFHTDLHSAETARPDSLEATYAIVGTKQPTATTVRLAGSRAELVETYRGSALFGDATVPIVGASRADVPMTSNRLRRVPDQHGNLHRNDAALDELEGILAARDIVVRAADMTALRVDAPDLLFAGDDVEVAVATADGSRQSVRVAIWSEANQLAGARVITVGSSTSVATFEAVPPGAYSVSVSGLGPAGRIEPVNTALLVWDQPDGAATPLGAHDD